MRKSAVTALTLLGLMLATSCPAFARPPKRIEVKIEDLKFKPTEVDIIVGDTVVWVNNDDTDHVVKADDGSFNSRWLAAGKSYEVKFTHAGKIPYHDDLHPRMHGVIVVAGG